MRQQRRAFKVTVLMAKGDSIKTMTRIIKSMFSTAHFDPSTKVKVTYLRKSPWWKFWKRG